MASSLSANRSARLNADALIVIVGFSSVACVIAVYVFAIAYSFVYAPPLRLSLNFLFNISRQIYQVRFPL